MAIPQIVGAGLRAAKAAKAAKKLKKDKANRRLEEMKDKEKTDVQETFKDFDKNLNTRRKANRKKELVRQKKADDRKQTAISAGLLTGATGMAANEIRKQNKALDEKLQAEDKKAGGGLARRRRKNDGGLKVGQRKIARGCGKVMGNRRKKTLYT
tara:strand:+ start:820 stop:1284 length:465 start_codon:yes stop_codon:yes gene_type:complete